MTKKIYFSILILFCTQHTNAQWTSNTLLNTTVRDSSGTSEVTPLSATCSDGKTYISWFESFNGNYQLRMQLLDDSGNKLWNDEGLIVSAFPQNSALYKYDLKVDHNDNAIVAFQDERSGNLNVVAYMIDPSGSFLWGASGISLADPISNDGRSPVIGVTTSNNVIVAWNTENSTGTEQWIAYRKISPAGTLLWGSASKRIIDSSFVKKITRPTIAPSGTDDFLMLDVQQTGGFPYTNTMFVQRYDVNGDAVWPGNVQFSTKLISFFYFPKAVSDLNDGMCVGFNTSNPLNASLTDVYVQHIDASGNLWSATGTEAAATSTQNSFTPSLQFISSRQEIWVLLNIMDSGQNQSGISVQKFDVTGTALFNSSSLTVIPISLNYYYSDDFEDTGDGMIISFREFLSANNHLMEAIKIDYSGTSLWSPSVITFSSIVSPKLNVSEGAFHNNQVVVIWQDQRIDDGVYAQNIYSDGTIGPRPAGISNVENMASIFTLYPNPSSQFPVLKFDDFYSCETTLTITDAVGKDLLTKNISLNSSRDPIDLKNLLKQDLSPGIYFVGLRDKSGSHVQRWIKE